MQVTCTCGKKLYFGDDPSETQVCSRCGQTVGASGPAGGSPPPPKRSSLPARGAADGGGGGPPPPRRPKGGPPITTRQQRHIAGKGDSNYRLGCALILLVALTAVFVADFFFVYPKRTLRCGHEGKEAYLLGALPVGHACEGIKTIWFMDAARKAYIDGINMPANVEAISVRADLGDPPESYDIEMFDDGSLRAEPLEDAELATYFMAADGTVTQE